MVTADRHDLCRRALRAFANQTYENRELIVLDNGKLPVESLLEEFDHLRIRYQRVDWTPDATIGALRNRSLDLVTGDYVFPQWDDDDWPAPDMLTRQLAEIRASDADACLLPGTIVHIDEPEFFHHPFYGRLREGTAILHRRDDEVQFPDLRTTSDTVYKKTWLQRKAVILPDTAASLYVRHQHGDNMWGKEHFLRRMQTTPRDLVSFLWYRNVRRNILLHSSFRLSAEAMRSFEAYLRDSRDAGLFTEMNVPPPTRNNGV